MSNPLKSTRLEMLIFDPYISLFNPNRRDQSKILHLLLDKKNLFINIKCFLSRYLHRRIHFMYAVISSGGKQYKVEQGEIVRIEKLSGEIGAPVSFDKVLMISDGEKVQIGTPVLDKVTVQGHIVKQGKAKKIIVFKYKRRKRYRRKQGHRQSFTAIQIDSIEA